MPQIARMRDLLSRGIGVHHGGLLPIVKEVSQVSSLIKCCMSIKTTPGRRATVFSGIGQGFVCYRDLCDGASVYLNNNRRSCFHSTQGVNMPARCVVFSGTRKHDGRHFRELLPGEYTQMSGRAGRRGLDATGVVIIVPGEELPDVSPLACLFSL